MTNFKLKRDYYDLRIRHMASFSEDSLSLAIANCDARLREP